MGWSVVGAASPPALAQARAAAVGLPAAVLGEAVTARDAAAATVVAAAADDVAGCGVPSGCDGHAAPIGASRRAASSPSVACTGPPLASTWLPPELAARLSAAGEEAVARLARAAVPRAARLMRARNPRARPLDAAQREALRGTFGDLVDRVQVCFAAEFPDRTFHTQDAEALTFGSTIYVRAPQRPGDPGQLRLLAHELVHVRQFERLGSDLGAFSAEVARQLVRAGWDEEATPFEREANGLVLDLPTGGLVGGLGRR